jgi:gas vesicle protein
MAERDDFSSFLLGFIIGGLTGAVVALVMAPQSGEETRAVIREKAIELKDKAGETVDEAYARAEAAAIDARNRAEDLTKIARERAEELGRKGQVVLEEQKAKITSKVEATRGKKASSEGEA